MIIRTRIAVLAFAGILIGTAPALAVPPDLPPATNPAVVGQATAQLGLACTKCAAQVASSMVPFYQEVTAMIERLTSPTSVPTKMVPLMSAVKAVSGAMAEIEFKKPDPNNDR